YVAIRHDRGTPRRHSTPEGCRRRVRPNRRAPERGTRAGGRGPERVGHSVTGSPDSPPVAILAVDGGNSKTDVALLDGQGCLLAAVHGPTSSHQQVGVEEGQRVLGRLVDSAARRAGLPPELRPIAEAGAHCL